MNDLTVGGSDYSNFQRVIKRVSIEPRRPYIWMSDDDADAHVRDFKRGAGNGYLISDGYGGVKRKRHRLK